MSNGWLIRHDNTYLDIIIDNNVIQSDFLHIDLLPDSSTTIITNFQFYTGLEFYPVEFYIIGSNDKTNWTSLYHTTNAQVGGTYDHGGTGIIGAFSAITQTTNQTKHFRYVGIAIVSNSTTNTTFRNIIQELLLYGAEPSTTIDVKEKIEQVVANPTPTATLGTVVNKWSQGHFTDLAVGDFDVKQALSSLQLPYLTGPKSIARVPSVPLTSDADNSRVFASGNAVVSSDGHSYQPWNAFDNVYGSGTNPAQFGFATSDPTPSENIIIDGKNTSALFCILDLGEDSTTVLTNFQLYCRNAEFPTEFHIVGSNDLTYFTSLFYTDNVRKQTFANGGASTLLYALSSNTTIQYRHVGIVMPNKSRILVQELLLWGAEPSATIDVNAKIKHEVAYPTPTATLGRSLTPWSEGHFQKLLLNDTNSTYQLAIAHDNLRVKHSDNSYTTIGQPKINSLVSYSTSHIDYSELLPIDLLAPITINGGINRYWGQTASYIADVNLLVGRLVTLADQPVGSDNVNGMKVGYLKVGTATYPSISPIGITQHNCNAGDKILVCIRGLTTALSVNATAATGVERGSVILAGADADNGKVRVGVAPAATQARVGYAAQSNVVKANSPVLIYYHGYYQAT
jgi:hypothetical protein